MLASLRPMSPSELAFNSHRAQRRPSTSMVSPNSRQPSLVPPYGALRPVASSPQLQGSRPSQHRQRSWHHPYAQATRAGSSSTAFGPPGTVASSTPASGPVDMPIARSRLSPESNVHDEHAGLYRRHSPSQAPDRLPPPPAPERGWRSEQPSGHPNSGVANMPVRDAERLGHIGPSRSRGRSSTLSMAHSEVSHQHQRGMPYAAVRMDSPTFAARASGDALALPPRSWDDRRGRRDSFLSRHPTHEGLSPTRPSPPMRAVAQHSPLLFAPLSPNQDPYLLSDRRPSAGHGAPISVLSRAHRAASLRDRPGTPISPLNMDGLSMEDGPMPSVSGMAVPLSQQQHQQQRSPYDMRGSPRDYFASGTAERARSAGIPMHYEADRSPSGPSAGFGHRYDPRDYPAHHLQNHAAAGGGGGGGGYSGPVHHHHTDSTRFSPAISTGPLHAAPGPGYHSSEQIERERFTHFKMQGGYHPMTSGSAADYGYAAEQHLHPGSRMPLAHGGGASVAAMGHPPVDRIAHSRRRRRPPYSYASMITQAIASSSEGRMTLREIYTWISSNFAGYPMSGPDSQGWQNTVRHNLSLGKIFVKKARTAQDIYDSCSSGNPSQSQAARGKGGWWTLHPVVLKQIRSGERTHNDEFDDVERLMELESASGSAATAQQGQPSVSVPYAMPSAAPVMAPSSSRGSVSGSETAASAEVVSASASMARTLSRQRSYSDSVDPSAVGRRRSLLPSGLHVSTAPVSRECSGVSCFTIPLSFLLSLHSIVVCRLIPALRFRRKSGRFSLA
ncbi:hypothetical protein BCV70DRAFT_91462 [Testicularia cyperi]|uniref:Fork-head domain-containing protein n=1 Tax=Testicularia cyperi TaxID=1882483 RepID=A0A317XV86_9BASI|nr:hypothetical protein BCV70DRAFT_91462 [Testicularia cyperi]